MQVLPNLFLKFDSDEEARSYAAAAIDISLLPPPHQAAPGLPHCTEEHWEMMHKVAKQFEELDDSPRPRSISRRHSRVMAHLATVVPARVLGSVVAHFGQAKVSGINIP